MKVLWCWRCKMNVPMLDEQEFSEILRLSGEAMRALRERAPSNIQLERVPLRDYFRPVAEAYEGITGFREENPNAIMHHRISMYGPPCPRCGKVLRTATSHKCFECGFEVAPKVHD